MNGGSAARPARRGEDSLTASRSTVVEQSAGTGRGPLAEVPSGTSANDMRCVTLRAFAKINLSLARQGAAARRLSRRADHSAGDRSRRSPDDASARRGPFEIRCATPGVPTGSHEPGLEGCAAVVGGGRAGWRAARRARDPAKKSRCRPGLAAAAAMPRRRCWAFAVSWKLRVPDDGCLRSPAAWIGCPVSSWSAARRLGSAAARRCIRSRDLPRLWVVLVFPPFGVATAEAYAGWTKRRKWDRRGGFAYPAGNLARPHVFRCVATISRRPVIERHPVIGTLNAPAHRDGAHDGRHVGQRLHRLRRFQPTAGAVAAARALTKEGARVVTARFRDACRRGATARRELARKCLYRINSSFALRWSSHA